VTPSWRILMLLFVAARKGAYWRGLHLARHLARRGHQVTLMAMSPHNRFHFRVQRDQGVTLVETPDLLWGPLRSGWDAWDSLRRVLWLRDHDFDLVHAFDARPTVLLPALYLQARRRMPLVMDWEDWFGRGGSVEERPNPLVRALLRPVETFFEERFRTRADGSTVICSTLRDKAIALGVPPGDILLLRDGADLEGLRPLDRDACRRDLGLPAHAPIIGYVGAIFARDAHLMARAFDRVHAAWPSARLLLIGYVNLAVEDMVRAPGAVIRTGFVDYPTLNRYLAACDVCWLPFCDSGANRGRWPMKLNDYACVARPTVATAVGDVTQVMQAHEIGLLAQDTPQDLADRVLELLTDPARCTRLGRNARQVAQELLDWRRLTIKLEEFYGKVLSRGPDLAL
jgi:glycosyltransferase involved in cell wall biosynthesis